MRKNSHFLSIPSERKWEVKGKVMYVMEYSFCNMFPRTFTGSGSLEEKEPKKKIEREKNEEISSEK